MASKKKQSSREPTGHRLTWTTNEGQEEICLPTELQLINSTQTGGIVKYTCGALKRAREVGVLSRLKTMTICYISDTGVYLHLCVQWRRLGKNIEGAQAHPK
jgi:hypothetical protein